MSDATTEPMSRTMAAAILAGHQDALATYRAANRAALRDTLASGGDALHAEPGVPFPAKSAAVRRAEREYPDLAREIRTRAAVKRARQRRTS